MQGGRLTCEEVGVCKHVVWLLQEVAQPQLPDVDWHLQEWTSVLGSCESM
jgi:hypothetical protein